MFKVPLELLDINYSLNFVKKKKIATILTAHNLEDQVETFLSDYQGEVV